MVAVCDESKRHVWCYACDELGMSKLIIETGVGLPNSNSYVTVTEFYDFIEARYPMERETEHKTELALVQSCDYIQSLSNFFKGDTLGKEQALCWPRKMVFINGELLDFKIIPMAIKNAQSMAAYLVLTLDIDLLPDVIYSDERVIKREAVHSAVSVSYEDTKRTDHMLRKVHFLLYPLMKPTNLLHRV